MRIALESTPDVSNSLLFRMVMLIHCAMIVKIDVIG
jgi:hypothetical protein